MVEVERSEDEKDAMGVQNAIEAAGSTPLGPHATSSGVSAVGKRKYAAGQAEAVATAALVVQTEVQVKGFDGR